MPYVTPISGPGRGVTAATAPLQGLTTPSPAASQAVGARTYATLGTVPTVRQQIGDES